MCVKLLNNSFSCQCHEGYSLASDGRTCVPNDCQAPPLNDCPSNSYSDRFSSVCNKVNCTCPNGTTYREQCTLTCANNYYLAKIYPQEGKRFGKDFAAVDFSSVRSAISCVLSPDRATVKWNQASELSSYYCRRMNDPPTNMTLNGKSLLEHSKYRTVIGTLNVKDSQQGQRFEYVVKTPSFVFGCQGNQLVSRWHDPKLNGPFNLSDGGINVTVRATDNGVPPYWCEKEFRITVKDVSDPPQSLFISNSKVYENASVGSLIARLSAIDGNENLLDGKPHSNFTWELVDSDEGHFSLSGENLFVAKLFNHESQRYHRIMVKCSDYGSPVRSTEKYFVIDVQDVKEKPVSLKLTKSSVHESANTGTVVGQLIATDEDRDAISFDISQSDSDTLDKFAIGSVSCQGSGNQYSCQVDLMVKSLLDYEVKKSYYLGVRANDSDGHIFMNFHVDVINDNEQPTSVFLTGSHRVSEIALPGTAIGQLEVGNLIKIIRRNDC